MKVRTDVFRCGVFILIMAMVQVGTAQVQRDWAQHYNGVVQPQTYQGDIVYAMTRDAQNNLYLAGSSDGENGYGDYLVVKFDSVGNLMWADRYNGPGNYGDVVKAMTVDDQGNVYVTGVSPAIFYGNNDIATIKYNASGQRQWVARYGHPGGPEDNAETITLDQEGNVIVAGGSNLDYLILKYSTDGALLWRTTYSGQYYWTTGFATCLVTDSINNIYVSGMASFDEVTTLKYSAAGTLQWAVSQPPFSLPTGAACIQLDASGNVLVGGWSGGNNTKDFQLWKYTPEGQQLWAFAYGVGDNDILHAMALDAEGNVYAYGESHPYWEAADLLTIKVSTQGQLLWAALSGTVSASTNGSKDGLALDSAGNCYVTGWRGLSYGTIGRILIKYSFSGSELWRLPENGFWTGYYAVNLDPAEHIYTGGTLYFDTTDYDFAAARYSQIGISTMTASDLDMAASRESNTTRFSGAIPNPFNLVTSIQFTLPKDEWITLNVFDLAGRHVASLVDGHVSAGIHVATFDASRLAAGVYVYHLQGSGWSLEGKMVCVK